MDLGPRMIAKFLLNFQIPIDYRKDAPNFYCLNC